MWDDVKCLFDCTSIVSKWKQTIFNNVSYKYSIDPWCPWFPLWRDSQKLYLTAMMRLQQYKAMYSVQWGITISVGCYIHHKTQHMRHQCSSPWNAPCRHSTPECLPSLLSYLVVPNLWQKELIFLLNGHTYIHTCIQEISIFFPFKVAPTGKPGLPS